MSLSLPTPWRLKSRLACLLLFLWSGLGCPSRTLDAALPGEAGVEPLLALSSRTVDLNAAFGETASQDVRLVGQLASAARLRVESVEPAGPEVEVLPARTDQPEGLRLTMTGARVARVAGEVRVATGLEEPKTLTLLYSTRVLGNLTVEPTNPFIDLRAPGPVGVEVRVTSRRFDFRLDDARVVKGPFAATLAHDEAGHVYVVKVGMSPDRAPDDQRGLVGTLRLFSNDPAEPQKDVPLFALGDANRRIP
jgi:hypothetical protein